MKLTINDFDTFCKTVASTYAIINGDKKQKNSIKVFACCLKCAVKIGRDTLFDRGVLLKSAVEKEIGKKMKESNLTLYLNELEDLGLIYKVTKKMYSINPAIDIEAKELKIECPLIHT